MDTVGAERAGTDTVDADVGETDVVGADAMNRVPTLRFLVRVAMSLSNSACKNKDKWISM